MPRNHPRYNASLPACSKVPAWHRAAEETLLAQWLKANGETFYSFSRKLDMRPDRVAYLARGQILPDLGVAFRIQAATRGRVPAASWLGTTLGREVWNVQGVRGSHYWRKHAEISKAATKARRPKR